MTYTTELITCPNCGGSVAVGTLCRHRHPCCLSCCQLDHWED